MTTSAYRHDRNVVLRLVYLIFQQMLALIVLAGRRATAKDIELLVLRREVTVLRRTTPKPRFSLPTERCSPRSSADYRRRYATTASSHPASSCAGTAAWSPRSGSTRTSLVVHRSTR